MDWNDIRFFLSVATEGTLSKAAQKLNVSQPTVGRRIDALENTLGIRLFERTQQGYKLTTKGNMLIPHAEKMHEEALSFMDHPGVSSDELKGSVCVALGEMSSQFFANHLHDFRRRYPDIKIILDTSNSLVNMSRRDADIALRIELPKSGDLVAKKLVRVNHAIYGAKSYVERNPSAFTEDRYQKCDWVSDKDECCVCSDYRWLQTKLDGNEPVVFCRTFAGVAAAMDGGAGLGILSAFIADANPNLIRVSSIIDELSFDSWLVAHKNTIAQPRVRAVWDWMIRLYEDHRHEFEEFRYELKPI